MRAHSIFVRATLGGILASTLVFHALAQGQGTAAQGSGSTIDCTFFLNAYNAAVTLSVHYGTAVGSIPDNDFKKINSQYQSKMDRISNDFDTRLEFLKRLPAQDRVPLMAKETDIFNGQIAKLDRDFDLAFAGITRNLRDANPELKSLWAAYQDCLTKQQQAERQARETVVPPPPVKTKNPETPPTNVDDSEILNSVRAAPDPDEALQTLWQGAEAEIRAILEDMAQPADKPRKPRKRTRTGDGGEQATQAHDPGTSTAMIMLLGTAAGIAADRHRQHDSGGGGGTPVKPGSGGCTGGTCRR